MTIVFTPPNDFRSLDHCADATWTRDCGWVRTNLQKLRRVLTKA